MSGEESDADKINSCEQPRKKPRKQDIDFQLIDVDSYTEDGKNVIRLYGRRSDGPSIVVHVQGVRSYFYIETPNGWTAQSVHVTLTCREVPEDDLQVEEVERQNIMFYREHASPFLQISTATNFQLYHLVQAIEKRAQIRTVDRTYESNIPLPLRYLVDKNIQGACWVTIEDYEERADKGHYTVQECANAVKARSPEDWSHLADLVILSFDIECLGREGHFPVATEDPVIQISSILQIQGKTACTAIFTLGTCAPIPGVDVHAFETERELLQGWNKFLHDWDPDILLGYNIMGFDLPYLIERAMHIGYHDFCMLSRLPGHYSCVKDSTFFSGQTGARDRKDIDIPGRFLLDMMKVIIQDHKLRSYSLNSVSAHFLGDQKEDIHYSKIPELQRGDADSRCRLATYCIKDSLLPLRLLQHLMVLPNYVEMSRVTGVPLSFLMTRGQQIKVLSQLYRATKRENMVIPKMDYADNKDDVDYEGATVIEPKRGFYQVPIATLDFASLYPSIMIAHNLCYSTFVPPNMAHALTDTDLTHAPNNGHVFVKPHVRQGLLPRILQDLLAARKKAKADLKKETDPEKKAVLDGRQLALKISANSVYGFTGAAVGKLPLKPIAETVTSFGRSMIDATKNFVEANYEGAVVVYGDTDSVMVRFKEQLSVAEAMAFGKDAADRISRIFISPIKLEFEKVYYPYLLMNKKRYAGMYWTDPSAPLKLDCKGLETVRRDNCKLVATLMQRVLDTIFKEPDDPIGKAVAIVQQVIQDIGHGKVDMSQLIITKQLRKGEYKTIQPHVALVERMAKRKEGNLPKSGDRVEYVIIQGAKGQGLSERAENPLYALENSLPIDVDYYLKQQLKEPLTRVFRPILGDKTDETLFQGDHTRNRTSSVGDCKKGILAFTKKSKACAGCKSTSVRLTQGMCQTCEAKRVEVTLHAVDELNHVEKEVHQLWTQCRRCQNSMHLETITENDLKCGATDCPIFYRRTKVRMDAEKLRSQYQDLLDGTWDW
jgi:DNA polymerase delta subunit 1